MPTLTDLIKKELPIYVRNTSKGPATVALSIENEHGKYLHKPIVVPPSRVPCLLSTTATYKMLRSCLDLARMLEEGILTLLDPDDAKKELVRLGLPTEGVSGPKSKYAMDGGEWDNELPVFNTPPLNLNTTPTQQTPPPLVQHTPPVPLPPQQRQRPVTSSYAEPIPPPVIPLPVGTINRPHVQLDNVGKSVMVDTARVIGVVNEVNSGNLAVEGALTELETMRRYLHRNDIDYILANCTKQRVSEWAATCMRTLTE